MTRYKVFGRKRTGGTIYWRCILEAASQDEAYRMACRRYGSLYVTSVEPM